MEIEDRDGQELVLCAVLLTRYQVIFLSSSSKFDDESFHFCVSRRILERLNGDSMNEGV